MCSLPLCDTRMFCGINKVLSSVIMICFAWLDKSVQNEHFQTVVGEIHTGAFNWQGHTDLGATWTWNEFHKMYSSCTVTLWMCLASNRNCLPFICTHDIRHNKDEWYACSLHTPVCLMLSSGGSQKHTHKRTHTHTHTNSQAHCPPTHISNAFLSQLISV